jgi:hypothetical protein
VNIDARFRYGKESWFLRTLDDGNEVLAADIQSSQPVWIKSPGLHLPRPRLHRGRFSTRRRPATRLVAAERLVKKFRSCDWKRCVLRDSRRGLLRVDVAPAGLRVKR